MNEASGTTSAPGKRATPTFSWLGGELCLDFSNTTSERHSGHPREQILTYLDLVEWARQAELLTGDEARSLELEAARRPHEAVEVLDRALRLRETIYRIFSAVARRQQPEAADLAELNHALSVALAQLRLVASPTGYTWGWSGAERAMDRMLWPVARSAAELLVSDRLERLRECALSICTWQFLDASRNRSRRWCEMRVCGNVVKARRHYQRKRAAK